MDAKPGQQSRTTESNRRATHAFDRLLTCGTVSVHALSAARSLACDERRAAQRVRVLHARNMRAGGSRALTAQVVCTDSMRDTCVRGKEIET